MKSISLRIVNVGPFRDEFVDFDAAGDMFLITGKTGSGKTTIFDCMTYALYGKFPGERGGVSKEMRSKFALEGEKSFVDFVFSVAGSVYRVVRTLPFGKKESQVSLFHKTDAGEWTEAEGGKKKIDEIIRKNLIQLEMKEFNRIIMLPQGEFSEFLKQNSSERSETLSKLFPVEKYTEVINRLKEKCRVYAAKIDALESARLSFGDFDEEKAKSHINEISAKIEALSQKIELLEKSRDAVISDLHTAEGCLEKAKKNAVLEEKLAALEKDADSIQDLKSRLEKSEKASVLIDVINAVSSAQKRFSEAEKKCASFEAELLKREEEIASLAAEKESIEAMKARQGDFELEIKKLEEKKSAVQDFEDAKTAAVLSENELESAKRELEIVRETLSECGASLEEIATKWSIDFGENPESSIKFSLKGKIGEKEKNLEVLNRQLSDVKNCAALFVEADKIAWENAKTKEQIAEQEKAAMVTQSALSALEKQKESALQNEKASYLSKLLRVGEPCPVCGSLEHPAPATLGEAFTMDDQIEALKTNLENATSALSALKTEDAKTAALLQAKNTQADEILGKLELFGRNDIAGYETATAAKISALEDLIAEMEEDFKGVCVLSEKISSLKNTILECEKKAGEVEKKYAVSSSVLKEKEALTGGFSDMQAIFAELSDLQEKKNAEKKKIDVFLEKSARLETQKSEILGGLLAAKEQVESLKTELQSAEQSCGEKIAQSDFSDADAVLSAFIPANETAAFKAKIEQWTRETDEAKTLIGENQQEKSIAELESEMQVLSENEKAISLEKNAVLSEKQSLLISQKEVENKIATFSEAAAEYKKVLEEAEPYKMLFDDISGGGAKKTCLDTWVLALYFSEILEAANPKLDALSSGRYQFRIDTERSGGNGKKGLDFVVEDSYTGIARLPQTLSGGETFEASISLALALTEVVQNRSGGVRLESLFIDEGFGTLDDEALKKAMDVLRKIQENRVVGVISHVSDLSSEIHSRIFVKKERTGSTVFVNGVRCVPHDSDSLF